jgi:hypothetical protein
VPGRRLHWTICERLQRGYEKSHALLDAYSRQNLSMRLGFKPRLGLLWWCQAARSLLQLVARPTAVFTAVTSNGENRIEVIEVKESWGEWWDYSVSEKTTAARGVGSGTRRGGCGPRKNLCRAVRRRESSA